MHTVLTTKDRQGESGNVLFLILIAVALFAALSYAVTQSSRSGGGDAGKETNLVNSAQLTQYPAGIRTAIVRMIVGGVSPTGLSFNAPSDFTNLAGIETGGVFHPDGGGATYALAPAEIMVSNSQGEWVFNAANQINLVGTTNSTLNTDTADIIAFLPGIKEAVCDKINDQLGIEGTVPTETGINVALQMNATGGVADGIDITGGGTIGDTASTTNVLNGQPFGCFEQAGDGFVYYHVLIER